MKYIILFLLSVAFLSVRAAEEEPTQGSTLPEQYRVMKDKSETYEIYKVIKESTLDGFWRVVMDSVKKKEQLLAAERVQSGNYLQEINTLKAALDKKESSMADIVHASEHITVLGTDFTKTGFISGIGVLIAALIGLVIFAGSAYRLSRLSAREAKSLYEGIYHEFEDYKHHAVEKQIKLSRELQDYRNRVGDMKSY